LIVCKISFAPSNCASPEPNYYTILGVGAQADRDVLKKAFYHLTKLYHPDKNPRHVDKFKEISRAYRVLSDPDKKWEYDFRVMHCGLSVPSVGHSWQHLSH